jgi:CTP:molybdopterin cytidylyltransferase MocA
MEAMILAAGAGSRLNGVAAPFHKPLMLVNGTPLIVQVVAQAVEATEERCVVVCAPSNVSPIIDLLEATGHLHWCSIIVQPRPDGPGDAFICGARAIRTPDCLVLMGDNLMIVDDVKRIVSAGDSFPIVIGTRVIEGEDAERFTRILSHRTVEGPFIREETPYAAHTVWCGPLVVPTQQLAGEIGEARAEGGELKLGHWLGQLGQPHCVEVNAIDVGLPAQLEEHA